jgi:hypothetical protein
VALGEHPSFGISTVVGPVEDEENLEELRRERLA